jgi:hypothetical protein
LIKDRKHKRAFEVIRVLKRRMILARREFDWFFFAEYES